MQTIFRDIVAAVIFSKDGKLFMGMKDPAKGGVYPDCWHIPGGGVEAGETKEAALQRELLEEVGLNLDPASFKSVGEAGEGESIKTVHGEQVLCKMKFYVYRVDLDQEIEIRLDDDLVSYEWVELKDLGKYKLAPPSEALFKKLGYLS